MVCVLHVADVEDGEALETLCRTTQVLAGAGVEQVVLLPPDSKGADAGVIWAAATPADVRPLRCPRPSLFGALGALQLELAQLARERTLHAVHLHGLGPCLLGARALRRSRLPGRVLYSPHLSGSPARWAAALIGRLLQSHRGAMHCAAVTTSPTEAQTLSRLLNRSAEVLPHPVSGVFFAAPRTEGARPLVLADGRGGEAVDAVTRLCVLLNAREARVSVAWLGAPETSARAQLDAAGVQVLAAPDDAARAQALSRAWVFVHLSDGSRLPLAAAQAMAAGVPCLVSDTPAHRALLRHGETGFVCTSERDLLEKLIVLLRDRGERQRIGETARADAERCFTLRHFERAVLRAYGLCASGVLCAVPSLPSSSFSSSTVSHAH